MSSSNDYETEENDTADLEENDLADFSDIKLVCKGAVRKYPSASSFANNKKTNHAKLKCNTLTSHQKNENIRKDKKSIFYELNPKDVDLGGLTQSDIESARKTGSLKLGQRLLLKVPDLVWSIELPTEEDRKVMDFRFDDKKHAPWWTFNPLHELDVSYNCIKEIHPQGSAVYSIKELIANNNWIVNLSDAIGDCKYLQVLNLNNNELTKLPKNICALSRLIKLLLQNNKLKELPDHIGDLTCLKKLDISSNDFSTITPDISFLSNLVDLNMSDNKINSLLEEIQSMRSLKILNVSNNNIHQIPSLNNMSNLSVFIACKNKIKTFPDFKNCRSLFEIRMDDNEIEELLIDNLIGTILQKMSMRNNKLSQLPDDIFRLSTLKLLDIRDNKITKLPYSLVKLRCLSELLVLGNPVENIRQDIIKCGTIRIISYLKEHATAIVSDNLCLNSKIEEESQSFDEFSFNGDHALIKIQMNSNGSLVLKNMKLSSISSEVLLEAKKQQVFLLDLSQNEFSKLPTELDILKDNLSVLIINQNNIQHLSDTVGQLKHLGLLELRKNKIESLPSTLADCKMLKGLILECNCFTVIPEVVYSLKSLEVLNFSGNKIKEIDAIGLKKLNSLFVLNLSNNNIEKVPPELGYLTQIKELDLYGNPFKCPRYSLLSKGTKAILEYLRNKAD